MKLFKNAIHWVLTQFRTHTARSLLVTIPALALVTAGILWACGEFTVYSYLPNRAYILGENERKEPQTLEEMLHLLSEPDVDTLLRNPAIAQELLSAGTLTVNAAASPSTVKGASGRRENASGAVRSAWAFGVSQSRSSPGP